MDLHVLRAQQLLDAEAANLEHLISASSLDGKTTLAAKPTCCTTVQIKNLPYSQIPVYSSEQDKTLLDAPL